MVVTLFPTRTQTLALAQTPALQTGGVDDRGHEWGGGHRGIPPEARGQQRERRAEKVGPQADERQRDAHDHAHVERDDAANVAHLVRVRIRVRVRFRVRVGARVGVRARARVSSIGCASLAALPPSLAILP